MTVAVMLVVSFDDDDTRVYCTAQKASTGGGEGDGSQRRCLWLAFTRANIMREVSQDTHRLAGNTAAFCWKRRNSQKG